MKNHRLKCMLVLLYFLTISFFANAQEKWNEIQISEDITVSCEGESYNASLMNLPLQNINSQPVNLDFEVVLSTPNGEMIPFTPVHYIFMESTQTTISTYNEFQPKLYTMLYDELISPNNVMLNLHTVKLQGHV